jgi:hypothetical protein
VLGKGFAKQLFDREGNIKADLGEMDSDESNSTSCLLSCFCVHSVEPFGSATRWLLFYCIWYGNL